MDRYSGTSPKELPKVAHMVSQRGGACIGYGYILSWNGTWPFARLDATESGITLKFFPRKQYHFDKDSVSAIREYKNPFLFARGVQILHTKNDYPPFIVFWTHNPFHWSYTPKRLISQLRELGFAVQD
jgi:hypothetical protein